MWVTGLNDWFYFQDRRVRRKMMNLFLSMCKATAGHLHLKILPGVVGPIPIRPPGTLAPGRAACSPLNLPGCVLLPVLLTETPFPFSCLLPGQLPDSLKGNIFGAASLGIVYHLPPQGELVYSPACVPSSTPAPLTQGRRHPCVHYAWPAQMESGRTSVHVCYMK